MPEKFIYDSLYGNVNGNILKTDENKFKMEIVMKYPFNLKMVGFGASSILAEYQCFYNLFRKIMNENNNINNNRKLIDDYLMNKLIYKYDRYQDFECDHRNWNDWWFDDNNNPFYDIFDYFKDISLYKYKTYKEKAVYLLNLNRDFDKKYGLKLNENEIMMLWYHCVCYLYPIKKYQEDEMKKMGKIGSDKDGNVIFTKHVYNQYTNLLNQRRDLLLFLMQTFYFRREFFENISKIGFLGALDQMKIKN